MNVISGIGESGFLAHSAFSASIATKDSNGNIITATYLSSVDLTPYQTVDGMTAYQEVTGMTAYQQAGSYLSANVLDNVSGDWNEVSAKLDTSAFSDVSGTFLTAHQDLSNYQTTAGMTAYQTTAGMSNYATTGDLDYVSGVVGNVESLLASL